VEETVTVLDQKQMDDVIAEHLEFEGRDDVEGVLSTLTDDVIHDMVGMPWGPQHGKEGARKNYELFFPNMEVQDTRDVRRLYGPDHVIWDMECDALVNGRILGLEEREQVVTFRVLHVFEFRDGKISRENVLADFGAVARAFEK
jgi:predicted ester cyclase